MVISLGDSFHDVGGSDRLPGVYAEALSAMQRGRDWIWITGNHDPDISPGVGGSVSETIGIGPLIFRHEPAQEPADGEIAGHLHPSARVRRRGRSVRRRCFVTDGNRMIMPAFGTLTGGLNIRNRAFDGLFDSGALNAFMIGRDRLYGVCLGDCLPG